MKKMLNDKELEQVVGGIEETTYKYNVQRADWVHCGPDKHSVWLILDTVSTNDSDYLVNVRRSDSSRSMTPIFEDDTMTKAINRIYDLYERYGGNIASLR